MGWAVNQANQVWLEAISNPDAASLGELYWQEVLKAAKRAHREKKEEAANLGTEVHDVLEKVAKQQLPSEGVLELASPEAAQRAVQAIQWLASLDIQPVAVERRIYSRKHGFVGTLDKLFRVQGKLTLLDWKTSTYLYPEFLLQTAAYCLAYTEETGIEIESRCLVRLGSDGELEPHWFPAETLEADKQAFLHALGLYTWLQQHKAKSAAPVKKAKILSSSDATEKSETDSLDNAESALIVKSASGLPQILNTFAPIIENDTTTQ